MGWDTLPEITLLRPWWLLAAGPVAAFAWRLHKRRGALGDWLRVADPALLSAMAALGRVDGPARPAPMIAALTGIGLIVLALSGPSVERRDALSFRNLDGVLLLVDVSPSMTGDGRWTQMQTMGRFGIASLGTRPGGLIAFAGDAYVATDMTLDHVQLGQTFSLLDGDTVPDPGSRPERALALAAVLLEQAEVIAGDVIVFTDMAGFGQASLAQAAAIAEQGARLSVVTLDAQASQAETHAALGGGRVFALDQTEALADWLSDDARTRLAAQDFPLLFWKDMGRYLVALALLPVLLLFRREVQS